MQLLHDRSTEEGPNELIRSPTSLSRYHEMGVMVEVCGSVEWGPRKRHPSAHEELNLEGRRWDVAGSTNSVEGSSEKLVSLRQIMFRRDYACSSSRIAIVELLNEVVDRLRGDESICVFLFREWRGSRAFSSISKSA